MFDRTDVLWREDRRRPGPHAGRDARRPLTRRASPTDQARPGAAPGPGRRHTFDGEDRPRSRHTRTAHATERRAGDIERGRTATRDGAPGQARDDAHMDNRSRMDRSGPGRHRRFTERRPRRASPGRTARSPTPAPTATVASTPRARRSPATGAPAPTATAIFADVGMYRAVSYKDLSEQHYDNHPYVTRRAVTAWSRRAD